MSSGEKKVAPLPAAEEYLVVRVLDVKKNVTREVKCVGGRVEKLMEAIDKEFGIPIKRQRLICSGRLLRADERLDASISKTIHLFPRSEDAPPARSITAAPVGLNARRTTDRRMNEDPFHTSDFSRLALFESAMDIEQQQQFEEQQLSDVSELGTPREFFWGFVLGMLLGFIMLLYLWERSISHRQKMGILAGATAQLFVKYLHSGFAAAQTGP
uniref:Ubiquitin-like domain-containing protein n=1 Tax=Aureoumbra lagunensis TaxID=44058 RepID=A0A7S3JWX2_9STRA